MPMFNWVRRFANSSSSSPPQTTRPTMDRSSRKKARNRHLWWRLGGTNERNHSNAQENDTDMENSETNRRRQQAAEKVRLAAVRSMEGRTLQFHDFNANTMITMTLGDGRMEPPYVTVNGGDDSNSCDDSEELLTSLGGDETGTSSSSIPSSGNHGFFVGGVMEDAEADADVGWIGQTLLNTSQNSGGGSVHSSNVTSQEDEYDLEKKIEAGVLKPIVDCTLKILQNNGNGNTELFHQAITALEDCLEKVESSQLDLDLRARGHYNLATSMDTEHRYSPESIVKHCHSALLLLGDIKKLEDEGRYWYIQLQIIIAKRKLQLMDNDRTDEIVQHIKSARLAMWFAPDSCGFHKARKFQIDAHILLGHAWAGCQREPICENLIKAWDAFEMASSMMELDLEVTKQSIHLASLGLDAKIRFLRHRRMYEDCKRSGYSSCYYNAPCQKLAVFTADRVVKTALKLKEKAMIWLNEYGAPYGEKWTSNFESGLSDLLAKAYLERAEERSGWQRVGDLKRAQVLLQTALRTTLNEDEFFARPLSRLREELQDLSMRVKQEESKLSDKSDEESESSDEAIEKTKVETQVADVSENMKEERMEEKNSAEQDVNRDDALVVPERTDIENNTTEDNNSGENAGGGTFVE